MNADSAITTSNDAAKALRAQRIRQWIDLLSALLLAAATISTAWSGYQSARWGGEQSRHAAQTLTAIVRAGKYADLAEQKTGLQISMFGQWAAAVGVGNDALADFLFARFPEPLKSATTAWRATNPLTNSAAPATPFAMPEYVLAENSEAERWEEIAATESAKAESAGEISDHYLVFTIIFATVFFFGGISGKFNWQLIDLAVLVLGALALISGIIVLITTPVF
jgi:hypothetical protein